MGKRGSTKHMKRIATPKAVPVTNRKEKVWIIKPMPGPHGTRYCISLGVLLRDVLKVASTAREVRKILYSRKVLVDGKGRTNEKFPVGMMDVVSIPDEGKHYRILVDWKGRLIPVETDAKKTGTKILKVVKKHITKGGKVSITLHDGRNMIADNNVRVGDSVIVKIPKAEMVSHLKLESGARCLVEKGKHSGKVVKLREILKRRGGKKPEVLVEDESGGFETVLDYLLVVDKDFEVKK
jgi:small subunit ribosomal protein S4e